MAIIAGNFDLAEIIKVHKTSDVGKLVLILLIESGQCVTECGQWRRLRKVITG